MTGPEFGMLAKGWSWTKSVGTRIFAIGKRIATLVRNPDRMRTKAVIGNQNRLVGLMMPDQHQAGQVAWDRGG
jgi:hypothetical protein